jgi:GAF domain-containing protein
VLDRGQSLLFPLIEDDAVLGHTASGAPLLAMLGAGSLLSVPLLGSRGVRGALTLIRRSNRGSFRLADLGLIEEIGEHIGLALPPRPST